MITNLIMIVYLIITIYFCIGIFIWEDIDKKTRYKEINDEYLKLPIILGNIFSYFFIKKIKRKRKIEVIRRMLNDIKIKIMFIGFDYLSDVEKNNYIICNRIIKIDKIRK